MEYSAAVRREALLEDWLLRFYFFSAAGWVWEVLLTGVTDGNWVNRGLLHGPWLPIYGIGGVLLTAMLEEARHPAEPFLTGMLLGGTVEYGTALILENCYHQRWWDYSGWLGSIQGRICLASIAAFAAAGWLVSWAAPPITRLLGRIPGRSKTIFCRTVSAIFALDWALSLVWPNAGAGITCPL